MIHAELLTKAAEMADVKFEGLLKKTGMLRVPFAHDAKDVVGFDYIVHTADNCCMEFYAANPPLVGMTKPKLVTYPMGLMIFNRYNIDYKKVIEIFHKGDWGDLFTSLVLYKPLYPGVEEPYWHIVSHLGVQIIIGADTGSIFAPGLKFVKETVHA